MSSQNLSLTSRHHDTVAARMRVLDQTKNRFSALTMQASSFGFGRFSKKFPKPFTVQRPMTIARAKPEVQVTTPDLTLDDVMKNKRTIDLPKMPDGALGKVVEEIIEYEGSTNSTLARYVNFVKILQQGNKNFDVEDREHTAYLYSWLRFSMAKEPEMTCATEVLLRDVTNCLAEQYEPLIKVETGKD